MKFEPLCLEGQEYSGGRGGLVRALEMDSFLWVCNSDNVSKALGTIPGRIRYWRICLLPYGQLKSKPVGISHSLPWYRSQWQIFNLPRDQHVFADFTSCLWRRPPWSRGPLGLLELEGRGPVLSG